jgi:hypothetical protein
MGLLSLAHILSWVIGQVKLASDWQANDRSDGSLLATRIEVPDSMAVTDAGVLFTSPVILVLQNYTLRLRGLLSLSGSMGSRMPISGV